MSPILLSKQLIDTEYGSLLNIADQILKRWSNNGQVEYKNFNYKDPSRWEFDDPLLHTVLQMGYRSLTFNWNTTGQGYSIPFDNTHIFAITRTGALPVSYLPEGQQGNVGAEIVSFEDRAHDFFARQSDPILVQVARYLAFYQIAKKSNIFQNNLSIDEL